MTQRNTEAPYRLTIVRSEIRVEQPKEFEKSFFREEYKSILRAVGRVIESSEEDIRQRSLSGKCRPYYPDIRIHNIVPIIGPRGSGKSSILHSVASILRESDTPYMMDSPLLKEFYGENGIFCDRKFFVTESIDGSLLEPHEDIFLTILAQMKLMLPSVDNVNCDDDSKFHTLDSNYNTHDSKYLLRAVRKKLDELYKSARQIEETTTNYRWEDMTGLAALDQLSDSVRLRQDLRELLLKFLYLCTNNPRLMHRSSSRFGNEPPTPDKCYLVVLIDDLDLNVDHGYRMLEKLHRYLMLPNVIILLAFDQDQFKRLCEFYFYRMIPTYDSRMNDAAFRIEALARQYLEKVMPMSLRTYVPQLATRRDVKVELREGDKIYSCLPKHLVFRLLYEKLGIRMDTDGGKRHFLERNSLRNFVNTVNLLQSMVSPYVEVKRKGVFDEEIFRYNHRIMHQEITHGMATAWLSDTVTQSQYRVDTATTVSTYTYQTFSSKELFENIVEAVDPIPRTFRNFFFSVKREGKQTHEDITLPDLAASLDYYDFSYGEILHIIYYYGRISKDKKKLIHCLLAYYSLVMNQCYLNLRQMRQLRSQEDAEKQYQRCRKAFLELMNGSVSGSWANDMVPAIRNVDQYYGAGLRKVENMKNAFVFESETIKELFESKLYRDEEKIRYFFRSVLIIGMLFDHPNYKLPEMFTFGLYQNGDWDDLAERLKNAGAEMVNPPSFRPVSGKGTFSFLNFVSSTFQYHEYIEKLLAYTIIYAEGNIDLFDFEDSGKAEDAIKTVKGEIEKEFQDWDRRYYSFAMPLYDLDVCYNLVKRMLQDRYGKQDFLVINDPDEDASGDSSLLDIYLSIYQATAKRLNSNDRAYLEECKVSLNDHALRPRYADAFCECPFIKWLGIQRDDCVNRDDGTILYTTNMTQKLLKAIFTNLMNPEVSNCNEDGDYLRRASYDD